MEEAKQKLLTVFGLDLVQVGPGWIATSELGNLHTDPSLLQACAALSAIAISSLGGSISADVLFNFITRFVYKGDSSSAENILPALVKYSYISKLDCSYSLGARSAAEFPPSVLSSIIQKYDMDGFFIFCMGVPKLFRYLVDRYPLVRQTGDAEGLRKRKILPDIDNFYLDMNGIIHNFSHSDGKSLMKNEQEIFEAVFLYIETLVDIVRPTRVLFLAVDGVAPRAKMNQQRSRRFRSALEALEHKDGPRFDSNCITPGTEFMCRLSSFLIGAIRSRIYGNGHSIWTLPTLKVFYSSHCVPGEGEHKIMDFIRSEQQQGRSPGRHCLYGLDADLIMLGLQIHEASALLIREVQYLSSAKTPKKAPKFDIFYLSLFREYLELEFKSKLSHEIELESLIDDYVLLLMLVGNDFLPNLPGLAIDMNGLGVIYDSYVEARQATKEYLTDSYGRIHFGLLCEVIVNIEKRLGAPVSESYYAEKLGYSPPEEEKVKMVSNYLETLQWTFFYYGRGLSSWKTFYSYHYSPLLRDIVLYIRSSGELVYSFDLGKPLLPFEQLLAVLPPYSVSLLPASLQHLMSADSAIKDFYPDSFSQDLNGKKRAWEAVVRIPFIAEKRLLDAMSPLVVGFTKDEKQRNQHGQAILWTLSPRIAEKKISFAANYIGKASKFCKKELPGFWNFPTLKGSGLGISGEIRAGTSGMKLCLLMEDMRRKPPSPKCGCALEISYYIMNTSVLGVWPLGGERIEVQWATDLLHCFRLGRRARAISPLTQGQLRFLEESISHGKTRFLDRFCIKIKNACGIFAVVCTRASNYSMVVPIELLIYTPLATKQNLGEHICIPLGKSGLALPSFDRRQENPIGIFRSPPSEDTGSPSFLCTYSDPYPNSLQDETPKRDSNLCSPMERASPPLSARETALTMSMAGIDSRALESSLSTEIPAKDEISTLSESMKRLLGVPIHK